MALATYLAVATLPPMTLVMNAGSKLLASLVRDREVLRSIAVDNRCSVQSVRNWASGACRPRYQPRLYMFERFGIALGSWDEVPEQSPRVAA